MSEIYLKSLREPINLNPTSADKIKGIFMDDTVPMDSKIEIGGIITTKRDIKSIKISGSVDRKQENTDYINSINREYLEERIRINKLSPQEKAKRVGMFGFLYWFANGADNISEEVKTKAIELQTKFFIDNPKRIHPDINIFKYILNLKSEDRLSNDFRIASLRIIERNIAEDIYCVMH